jgi:hypothetical protein
MIGDGAQRKLASSLMSWGEAASVHLAGPALLFAACGIDKIDRCEAGRVAIARLAI